MRNSNEYTVNLFLMRSPPSGLMSDVSTQHDVLAFAGRKSIERSSDFQKLQLGPPCIIKTQAINNPVTQHIILKWKLRLHHVEYLKLVNYCYVFQEAGPSSGICVENFLGLEFFFIEFALRVKILRCLLGLDDPIEFDIWSVFFVVCFCGWVLVFCWGDGRNFLNSCLFWCIYLYLLSSIYFDYTFNYLRNNSDISLH